MLGLDVGLILGYGGSMGAWAASASDHSAAPCISHPIRAWWRIGYHCPLTAAVF
jgi:hypothetical protein